MAPRKVQSDLVLAENAPLHEQVRKHLASRISKMKTGQRLPTVRKLSQEFRVGLVTVRRAMAALVREGFVIQRQGRGTFVRKSFRMGRREPGTARSIGLIIPDVEIRQNALILKGVEGEAIRRGCEVRVCNSLLDIRREYETLLRWADRDLAGILTCPLFEDPNDPGYAELIRAVRGRGRRIVFLDQYVPGLDVPAVMSDKVRMGYLATEHLIVLGHRKIAYVSTGRYDPAGRGNLMGYRQALEDYGIDYDENRVAEIPIRNSAGPAGEAVARKLKEDPRSFSAVASPQFSMTYGILKALARMKIKVPDDLAVVGGDMYHNPELAHVTHTVQPFYEMGREGVRLLLQGKDPHDLKNHVLLKVRLEIGTTCGAKRTTK